MRRALAFAAALAAGGLLYAGCPAAHTDYPTTACMTDKDCYKGERCTNNVCTTPPPDMAVDMHFYPFDFAMPDLNPDVDGGGGDL